MEKRYSAIGPCRESGPSTNAGDPKTVRIRSGSEIMEEVTPAINVKASPNPDFIVLFESKLRSA